MRSLPICAGEWCRLHVGHYW